MKAIADQSRTDMNAALERCMTRAGASGQGHTSPRDIPILARAYQAGTLAPERLARLDAESRLAVKLQAAMAEPVSVRPGRSAPPITNEEPARPLHLRTDDAEWRPPSPLLARLRRAGYDDTKHYTAGELDDLLQRIFGDDTVAKIAAKLELGR